MSDKGAMITDPAAIRLFSLNALIRAMDLEVRTGLKMSNRYSTLEVARRNWGIQSKTKKKAIVELRALHNQLMTEYTEGAYEPK